LKIQVVIPLWKRPEITKYCFDQLTKVIAESKHQLDVLCVISEEEYKGICDSYGFAWVWAENDPLGAKINVGILKALESDPDYIMTLNSDSVIKTELLDTWYEESFNKKEAFFGVDTVTFIDSETNQAKEYTYEMSILGVAKCMRADIVKASFKSLGKLYEPQRNKGLDDTMMENLIKIKCAPKIIKYKGQIVFDIKSEVNIWSWKHFENKGKAVKAELCYKRESDAVNLTGK
jgi:hypothetical protein